MHNLHIRDARDTDREAIRAVTLSAYVEYAATVSPQFMEDYRRGMLATLDEEGPVERIVVEQDGTIVGSVLLFPAGAAIHTPAGLVRLDWPEVRLSAAEERLMQSVKQWIDLGMPGAASFELEVYPIDFQLTADENQWIVKRRESQFLWSLKI